MLTCQDCQGGFLIGFKVEILLQLACLEDFERLGRNLTELQCAAAESEAARQWSAALRSIQGQSRGPAFRRWLPWVGSLAVAATATAATVFLALSARSRTYIATSVQRS